MKIISLKQKSILKVIYAIRNLSFKSLNAVKNSQICCTYASNFLAQKIITAVLANGSFDSRKAFGTFLTLSNILSAVASSPRSQHASIVNKLAHQSVNGSSQSREKVIIQNKSKNSIFLHVLTHFL